MKRAVDVPRLCQTIQRHRLAMQYTRQERLDAVRQLAGSHWSEEGTTKEVPLNLIALYERIIGPSLVPKDPRVMLSTFHKQFKAIISSEEGYANKQIKRMKLAETLRRVVTDALFSIGICKVALASPEDAAATSWKLIAGEPYAAPIDLDDFVVDLHGKTWSDIGYIGHRYRVPLSVVQEDNRFSKERHTLSASQDPLYNLEGDERINTMGRGMYGDTEDIEDMVDLWEVYLPRHRIVITLHEDYLTGAAAMADAKPLRVQKWIGPDCGPYHVLGFGIVPGNLMPKGPIQDLLDLHHAVNRSLRKLIRSVDRIKELGLVAGGALEDGSRIMQANDGELIRCDNPESTKLVVMGMGAAQHVTAIMTVLKGLFSWEAGNLDLIGGLSPQSKTATQDEMLQQNSGRVVGELQKGTLTFVSGVMESLCWYNHHHPLAMQKSMYTLPGLPEMSLQRQVGPQQRQAVSWEDMEVEVDPYSLQHNTPQTRIAALQQVMTQVLIPLAPLMQQQGIITDFNAYLKIMAKLANMPDLAEITSIGEPPAPSAGGSGGGEAPGMPTNTTRTNIRQDTGPGRTQRGDEMMLVNKLFGNNPGGNPERNGAMSGVGT